MTVAPLVLETHLAWTLAEAVKPYMTVDERHNVFVAIGSGETFAAIRGLFNSVAIKRIALRPDLVQECITWLQTYVGAQGRALPSSPHRGQFGSLLAGAVNLATTQGAPAESPDESVGDDDHMNPTSPVAVIKTAARTFG